MRGRAGRDPQLDRLEDAIDRDDILVGDRNASAQREHAEIGVGDIGGEGQSHRLLGKMRGFERFSGRAQIAAREAPDIDFITRAKVEAEGIADHGIGKVARLGAARSRALSLRLQIQLRK